MAKLPGARETPSISILAIHSDVTLLLSDWRTITSYAGFAARVLKFLELLRIGDIEAAGMIRQNLIHARVKGCDVILLEYGLLQKGGSPRLFEVPILRSHILVAGGLEKNKHGCAAIKVAKKRAEEISGSPCDGFSSIAESRLVLGASYEVVQIPRAILGRK